MSITSFRPCNKKRGKEEKVGERRRRGKGKMRMERVRDKRLDGRSMINRKSPLKMHPT